MECQIFIYNTHGLPWSVNDFKAICAWILELRPSIVCLQEVFVESTRKYYKAQLERCGYDVRIPNDYPVALLNSGLVTAVLRRDFTIVSECFCPYMDFHNVEWFANKGFHTLRLRSTASGRRVDILNTHTQSDTEVSWIFGREVTHQTRRRQIDQIVRFTEASRIPVLIAGDLNCEVSPHPHVRFLHPYTEIHLRKATFYHTGENLDHVAWLPLQWADPGCTFCDIERHGPRLVSCKVFEKPWSDHAPVLLTVFVPALPIPDYILYGTHPECKVSPWIRSAADTTPPLQSTSVQEYTYAPHPECKVSPWILDASLYQKRIKTIDPK